MFFVKRKRRVRNESKFFYWLIVAFVLFLLGWFAYHISSILLPFVLAFVFAYLLHPAVVALEKKRFPRWLATSVVMALFVVFILYLYTFLI